MQISLRSQAATCNDLEAILRARVANELGAYSRGDPLLFRHSGQRVLVEYRSSQLSVERDPTFFRLVVYPEDCLAWIAFLQVATPYRLIGHGKQLAWTAEMLSREFSAHEIFVHPLVPAQPFWERLGYRPATTTRVLRKRIAGYDP